MTALNDNSTAPRSTTAPAAPDSYALDDTLPGRIAQAAAVGILTALPDYLTSKVGLTVGYLTGLTGFGGLVAVANAQREDEHHEAPLDVEQQSAAKPSVALSFVLCLLALGAFINIKIARAFVNFLRSRGARKPWTLAGAIFAALTFAVSEAESRDREKAATN